MPRGSEFESEFFSNSNGLKGIRILRLPQKTIAFEKVGGKLPTAEDAIKQVRKFDTNYEETGEVIVSGNEWS